MGKISYKDAEVNSNWNGTKFSVKCRGFERRDLTGEDLAALIYPALDAAAKAVEDAPPLPPQNRVQ